MAMWRMLMVLLLAAVVPSQQDPTRPAPGGAPPETGSERSSLNPVRFDSKTGWPILPGDGAPAVEPRPQQAARPEAPATEPRRDRVGTVESSTGRDATPSRPASGMQLDSPLLEVFRATFSPAAFRELGGIEVSWRLKIHGQHGEVIGEREVRHLADCSYGERDRLEFDGGRTAARVGGFVTVDNQGIPSQAALDAAGQELQLFGMHLRMPWCFGDGDSFAVIERGTAQRNGERLMHLVLERRPPPSLDLLGPEADPAPRDRFELYCDPSTGQPRELVHRFACSQETRRVLLEDWREVEGVRMPFRRVYVDEALRPTTTVEIARLPERLRISERDFRLAM